jgi:orotidine-5'-phosphate decarboxylase
MAFEYLKVDAVTINAYQGFDAVEPLAINYTYRYKGAFVLCRTSNPSALVN